MARIVNYLLEPAVDPAATTPGSAGRPDAKIGFCFYDSGRELDRGPEERRFRGAGCGKEDSESFLMGLTPGWGDTYDFMLPGQSIDVSDLPDGNYRLWAHADPQGWFHEVDRDNNLTWVDMELLTLESGSRGARVLEVGPRPE